jgi:hypothetical protein
MVLTRPSAASGQTVSVPGIAQPARGFYLTWEHGPEGSGRYDATSIGNSDTVTTNVLDPADDRRVVAGYLKLAAQSESDDEKAIDADRRARRDRGRTLRAL